MKLLAPGDMTEIKYDRVSGSDGVIVDRGRWWVMTLDYTRERREKRSKDGKGACKRKCEAARRLFLQEIKNGGTAHGMMLCSKLFHDFNRATKILRGTTLNYERNTTIFFARIGKDVSLRAVQARTDLGAIWENTASDANALKHARRAFEWARNRGFLHGPNPFAKLSVRYVAQEKRAMSKTHLAQLLTGVTELPDFVLAVLWVFGAFRIGEVAALRYSTLRTDPDSGVVQWRIGEKSARHKGDHNGLKGHLPGQFRTLTLTPWIVGLIEALKAQQRERGYTGDLLFPTATGKVWHPDSFRTYVYNPLLHRVGLATHDGTWTNRVPRYVTEYAPHELRHTGITLRERLKLNAYMCTQELGHYSPRVASAVHAGYIHTDPETCHAEALILCKELQTIAKRSKFARTGCERGDKHLRIVPPEAA